jgi:Acetyltransferases, including N-acetylases of ribosomal proteins
MYPILRTQRLVLRPLEERDFYDMYTLYGNRLVAPMMEYYDDIYDSARYRNHYYDMVKSESYYAITHKDTDEFIGFIQLYQYKKRKQPYSQMSTAIRPAHWGKGYCTEAAKRVIALAFYELKTPWICANEFHDNPKAGKVLLNCGMELYKAYTMNKRTYYQYRYKIADFAALNGIKLEADYGSAPPKVASPYNADNPIRKIDSVTFVEQPTGYLCGQSVVAMLAGVSVDDVIAVMQNDKGTSTSEIRDALKWYGIRTATKARTKFEVGMTLPECCILSLRLPGYGHWSLYYKGKHYDPEFGVSDELHKYAELRFFWEITL